MMLPDFHSARAHDGRSLVLVAVRIGHECLYSELLGEVQRVRGASTRRLACMPPPTATRITNRSAVRQRGYCRASGNKSSVVGPRLGGLMVPMSWRSERRCRDVVVAIRPRWCTARAAVAAGVLMAPSVRLFQ